MKFRVFLLISSFTMLLLNCRSKGIVSNPSGKTSNEELTDCSFDFPKDWLGHWEGTLQIYTSSGLKQTIPMALDNERTEEDGRYRWAITYGKDSSAQIREYELVEIDSLLGHYIVDEKNGILLDAYLFDNELISVFEVMDNTLISSYERLEDKLIFSIKMYLSEASGLTGDTIIRSEQVPLVKNFKPKISQKAALYKKCLVE